MYNKLYFYFILLPGLLFYSCTGKNTVEQKTINNSNFGNQKSSLELKQVGEVRFLLDSVSAPKIEYVQLVKHLSGNEVLSFLNKNNKSIYFYNYNTQSPVKIIKIGGNNSGNDKIEPTAFYVDSYDSIYVYNRRNVELLLINSHGKFLRKKSLIANNNIRQNRWFLKYPQYYSQGSNPMIKVNGTLLFPGQSFESLQDSLIEQFKFTAYTDRNFNDVQFYHRYPDSLYGHNYNWSGEKFTEVYLDWNPEKQKLIFSFPVSHNLYVSELKDNNYVSVNGASNQSRSISSFPATIEKTKVDKLVRHVLESDEYGPVRYDPYRKLYYRFLRMGIKTYSSSSQWVDKGVSIVILDEDFKYLGETNIGNMKNWYIQNAFVNENGLHIEHIPNILDEDFLTYKIFNINKK